MADPSIAGGKIELPKLPAPLEKFIPYLSEHPNIATAELLKPYIEYEARLREIYAQEPERDIVRNPFINTVPIFAGSELDLQVRARSISSETDVQKEKFLMPLKESERKQNGSAAMVRSFKDFQTNFNLFSESALVDMNWDNVVAAGSSVVTALLPVPEKYSESKRAQRSYYHDILAPASDCDLFIYGLDEKQGLAKLQQIETKIKDAILYETTTIRTKNAVTIASQYPTRHVQIVLRLYHSISEILTGFDVDCSCVAYDGQQVYAAPRAVTAFMTQRNTVDLTRRSPSYENRLSKYSHRGFEVHWPQLERSRIDPTIFERSFGRTMGLARLLILEKLPKPTDRDAYLDQRRQERGRPPANRYHRNMRSLSGNIKEQQPDDVAEWVEEDEVSSYHTFTVPYGPKFHARKIEKLLYTKDLLLNSEWNKPKDRSADLHRHPCFFGSVEDVIHDCCGYCPSPVTDEELAVAEEEGKIYISGDISFLKDDPGRQTIGSFHPINDQDWCEMAYVGNTARLCQAIIDCDFEAVEDWFSNEEAIDSIDRRDYTGRTPLHLATMASTPEITGFLINKGARLTARLVDGKTPLHIASQRGNAAMVKALLDKSEANEEEEARKEDAKKALRKKEENEAKEDVGNDYDAMSLDSNDNSDEAMSGIEDNDDSVTQGSFIKIQKPDENGKNGDIPEEDASTPDVYDVNILAWDTPLSPLHLAIMNGNTGVIETLVSNFGADVLLPVKLLSDYDRSPQGAILTLALALQLPTVKAKEVVKTLLKFGASSAQADMDQTSAFHYALASGKLEILDTLLEHDEPAARSVLNHVRVTGSSYHVEAESPLTTAITVRSKTLIQKLLDLGADPSIKFQNFIKSYERKFGDDNFARLFKDNPEKNMQAFGENIQQPIVLTADCDLPSVVNILLEGNVDVNTMTTDGYHASKEGYRGYRKPGETILDIVRRKLKGLRKYKGEKNTDHPPEELKGDEYYLGGLEKGSYKYWTAEKDLELARTRHHQDLEDYQKRSEDRRDKKGLREKKEAIQELIGDFEGAENGLLDKGGKTFKELYPDIESPKEESHHYHHHHHHQGKLEPFKVAFSFKVSDLTDDTREGYLQLYEAAWHGDVDKIKSLTLSHWGPSATHVPLRVAVKDKNDVTPFAIAVWRGHKELAHTILNITQAQYQPEEPTGKHERYNTRPADSDEESDDDEDEVKVYSELVDGNFTVNLLENVGGMVKSKTTPMDMLNWATQIWRFGNDSNGWGTLLRYAIQIDDIGLLKYLLGLGRELTARNLGDELSKTFTVTPSDFHYAIEHGRTAILAEIIKTTGAGIPLDELVKKSGAEVKEAPKYYQGLSIHGKKRADWARAGRGDRGDRRPEKQHPPLLEAAYRGNIDSTEWFLSDAPIRMYKEFAATHQDDKRVETLSGTDEGFEGTISNWLGARSDLALHCAVLASNDGNEKSVQLIDYLIQAFPRSIESKSRDGWTPLHVAFHPKRITAARTLIAAGADQLTRDKLGRNIVHCALRPPKSRMAQDPMELRRMLELIDRRVIHELFLQRSQDNSSTPLAQWLADINTYGRSDGQRHDLIATLKVIIEFSGAKDLDEFGGEGDMPLHLLVRKSVPELAKVVIEERPELLFRENATGRTAYEMAEDAYLRHRITNYPRIPNSNGNRNYYFTGRSDEIQDRDPETFIKKDDVSDDKQTDVVATYRICYEAAKRNPRKRKLVSLSAANEIAQRLALRQRADRDESERFKERDEEEKGFVDEVSKWMT
ncbi:MAG: hypothetical protein M1812_007637 [Candelaria pacifica]|nr:MAG: hypothetical protein M1812_007637 [Candelaria pacifica]